VVGRPAGNGNFFSVFNSNFGTEELGHEPPIRFFRNDGKRARYSTIALANTRGASNSHVSRSSAPLAPAHIADNERAKSGVFQVASYRAVEQPRTLDAFFSEVDEPGALVMILTGLGIVSIIARRRIVG
jgi:hypothetical protein